MQLSIYHYAVELIAFAERFSRSRPFPDTPSN